MIIWLCTLSADLSNWCGTRRITLIVILLPCTVAGCRLIDGGTISNIVTAVHLKARLSTRADYSRFQFPADLHNLQQQNLLCCEIVGCDLPPYDDSSKNHDFTFSNPLFDIDEDFTLSDESFSEEDIPKENFIIFSNPLFDLDEEIASTKVDRINDEVLEGIHSIPPGIDSFDAESDLVESVLNRDISIDSSPKIDSLSNEFAGELILPKSIPPEIEEVEFDPEGDILFLESLLYDNSSPRPPEALQANSNAIVSNPPFSYPRWDN
ncbi:hypothetical protein Tco_1253260 [Tanacetum coccineum]